MARPAVRSYADLASMPAAGPSSPDGSIAFSQADGQFAERVAGVWTLIPNPNTPGSIDGTYLANVADDQAVGGVPVVHAIDVPDGPSRNIDIVLTHKTRVYDVTMVKTGGNADSMSDSVQVKNGPNAITDTMPLDQDKSVTRSMSIDDAYWDLAAGGTLRVTVVNGSGLNSACTVFVHGYRVA